MLTNPQYMIGEMYDIIYNHWKLDTRVPPTHPSGLATRRQDSCRNGPLRESLKMRKQSGDFDENTGTGPFNEPETNRERSPNKLPFEANEATPNQPEAGTVYFFRKRSSRCNSVVAAGSPG